MRNLLESLAAAGCNVPRETLDKLNLYCALLNKWQASINLISDSTMSQIEARHFADSAQIHHFIDIGVPIYDLGSGAGFPGLVISIIKNIPVNLVESDFRKCVFLNEVIRETKSHSTVVNKRVENLKDENKKYIVSRGFAPLSKMLSAAKGILPGANCYFHKGKNYANELNEASATWSFDHIVHQSKIDPSSVIINLYNVRSR